MFITIKSYQLAWLLLHFFSPHHSQAFFTLLSQKVSPYILKELSSTAQISHQQLLHTSTPVNPPGVCHVWEKKNKNQNTWMKPSQTSGYLQSRKMTAFSNYHFQNICHFQKMPTSACVALLSWKGSPPQALHSSFLHHALQEGGKKKSTTSHTLFWVLFFPFLG